MKITFHSPSTQRAFTLVEILVTIAIVVVLLSLSFGVGATALRKANENKTRAQINLMDSKLQEYELDNGEFPEGNGSEQSSAQLFEALYERGIQNDTRVYMPEFDSEQSDQFKKITEQGVIFDPFKVMPYFYLRGTDENGEDSGEAFNPDFDLWSLGPNRVGRGSGGTSDEDTADDIGNW